MRAALPLVYQKECAVNAPIETAIPEIDNSNLPAVTNPVDADVDIEVLKVVPTQFEIVDAKTANWLVRKVIEARQYAQRVKEWAELEQRRAEREEQTLLFLFGRQLQGWVRAEIASGRKKSVGLPAGTVGFRKVNASLHVDDESAVLLWCKKNCPTAVVRVEKLSRSVLSDHFKATGEIPDDGAHVEPERESFSIK